MIQVYFVKKITGLYHNEKKVTDFHISFLIIKFHQDLCGTLRIYQEALALFWVNSVFAWLVIQDEKGGPAPGLVLLSRFS